MMDKALSPSSEPIIPGAEPPIELDGLEVSAPKVEAAGMTAVIKSMAHVWGMAGVVRGTRTLTVLNQKNGVDCPSCAWPDPDGHRSFAEFCENGAKAIAWEADKRRLSREFFEDWDIEALARESDYWLGQQGRLTEPMILREGRKHYEPISWDDAFQLLATELNALASPDDAYFYTSGRASNEAAFLYQLFVRQFGTNNLPDCSNMCHESSGSALSASIGIGKGTVKLEDFEKADVILILGQNPGTNHPRMLTALQKAKREGAIIIAVNPLKETGLLAFRNPQEISGMLGFGTHLTDHYLQVRINGDAALLQGLMKALLTLEAASPGKVLAHDFIAQQTEGFAATRQIIEAASWDRIVSESGITREKIEEIAGILAQKERIIACWAMGLTQHKQAVATIQDVVNLLLMRGSIGKEGAGLCPVRGHSNVQGDRTMGIWEKPPAWFLDALGQEFEFEPPRKPGHDTVEAIKEMYEHPGKIFFALGGNFLSATPDTEYTAAALRRCRLTAQVSIKLNRSHLIPGKQALILPCLGRTEIDQQANGPQFVTTENSMGVVQSSHGRLAPASLELLSEPAIVARLAKATLGTKSRVTWDDLVANYDGIRDHISRVIPGFNDYNQRVREPGGFYLPNGPREGKFTTSIGKARFTAHQLPVVDLAPHQLLMMTIRTHDQFNTTVYGLDDRYRGLYHGRRVILMNHDDMVERQLQAGDLVDLASHFQGETRYARRFIVVPYDIPKQCSATYFPETNVLVPIDSVADISNTPTSKSVVITVVKSSGESHAS
jgi:molybdopterin-dependent oxidoreductase alpha subunit